MEREAVCAATPLAQDESAERPSTQARATPAAEKSRAAGQPSPAPRLGAGVEPPTYLDPEKAQALIERFKEGIGRRP